MEYETERLKIRLIRPTDVDTLYEELLSKKEVLYFLDWPWCHSLKEAEDFVQAAVARIEKHRQYYWIMEEKLTNSFVGCIAICSEDMKRKVGELEYITAFNHRGKGYMTEAVKSICEFMIKELGFYRVEAVCNVENNSSSRVLEKAGMKYEGTLRGRALNTNSHGNPGDLKIYSFIQTDLLGSQGI